MVVTRASNPNPITTRSYFWHPTSSIVQFHRCSLLCTHRESLLRATGM